MTDRMNMDPQVRSDVAAAGGRARAENLTADERAASARQAANAAHTPAALARRIVRAWPGLSEQDQAEVRAILRQGGVTARARQRPDGTP